MNTVLDNDVKKLLENVNLDTELTGKRSPKIKSLFEPLLYSKNVFFSLKKCGENDCTTCLPKRLPSDIFDQLNHLPNPIPDPYNEGNYVKFNNIYGTETTEEHMASLRITA